MALTAMTTDSLLLLLNWMSPTFPIGSFAYSHGLEQAIADGRVTTQHDVQDWITDLLQSGSGWNDAVLFAQCWHSNPNELALALAGSAERYSETTHLGRNFNIAVSVWMEGTSPTPSGTLPTGKGFAEEGRATSPSPLGRVPEGRERSLDHPMAYPVAAGLACHHMNIPQDQALAAYLQGFAAALVSVAVRLVPLGQTAGLRVLRNLAPLISATILRVRNATLDDLGSNCIASDIAAMKHETLEPRIFRT
jgi:urease accessory protein